MHSTLFCRAFRSTVAITFFCILNDFLLCEKGPFVAAWSEALSRQPRAAAYMEKDGQELISRAGDVLKDACTEGSKQSFKVDSDRIFYSGKGSSSKMSVYTVRIFY